MACTRYDKLIFQIGQNKLKSSKSLLFFKYTYHKMHMYRFVFIMTKITIFPNYLLKFLNRKNI